MPDQPDEFRLIPLDQIIEPWVVLRVVNRESVEYLELRDSIGRQGLLNSICVRPSPRRPGKIRGGGRPLSVRGVLRIAAAGNALHRQAQPHG